MSQESQRVFSALRIFALSQFDDFRLAGCVVPAQK